MRKRIGLFVVIILCVLLLGGALSGSVLASEGQRIAPVEPASVTPSALKLQESVDGTTWTDTIGDLALGYSVALDPSNDYYYLDIKTLEATPALADGDYEFFFDAFRAPDAFWIYWAAKGVVDGATGWQGIMWEIINGRQPMFYLAVSSSGKEFGLVDGLQYQLGGTEAPLRVNGDYPLDTYHFGGWVTDGTDSEYLNIQITFTKQATVSLVEPTETWTIDGCGYLDVYIHLANVHDLYAVDVALTFDPGVLEVVDLLEDDPGTTEVEENPGVNLEPVDDWFTAGYWVKNEADNEAGTIRYAAALLNTAAPVDAEGDIAKIRFRAKAIGSSAVTVTDIELSDRDGFLVGRPVDYLDPAATITTQFTAAGGLDLGIIRLNPSTVQLSWPKQTMDAGVEYNLYRSTLPYFEISDPEVGEMDDTAFVEGGTTVTFDDNVLGNVDDNYFYSLQVTCSNGFKSEPSWQVGKFEFELFETPTTDLSLIGYVLDNPALPDWSSQGTPGIADMNDLGKHIEDNIFEALDVSVIAISTWNPSAQNFTSYGYPSSNPFVLVMKQPYRIAIDIDGDYYPYKSVIWAQVGKLPQITQSDYGLIETPTTDYVWILQPLEMSGITSSTQLAAQIKSDTSDNVNVLAVSAWNGIAQSWTTSSIATRFGYPYRLAVDLVGTQPIYYWP